MFFVLQFEYSHAQITGETLPGVNSFISLKTSVLKEFDNKRIVNLVAILQERLTARFGLNIDSMEEVSLAFTDAHCEDCAVIVKGDRIKKKTVTNFFNRLLPGEMRTATIEGSEYFFVPGVISAIYQNSIMLVTKGELASTLLRSKEKALIDDKEFQVSAALIKGGGPDFFMFTKSGTKISEFIESLLNVPYFIKNYKTFSLSIKENFLVLIITTLKDADKNRMQYVLKEKLKENKTLSSLFEIHGEATKEVGIFFRMKFNENARDNIVRLLIDNLLNIIPDTKKLNRETIQCVKNMSRLKNLIISGKLNPDRLNTRVDRRCFKGGTYIYRELPTGPEVYCSRHSILY